MKLIKRLSEIEQKTLEDMRDNHKLSITRKRAHSILLNQEGYYFSKIGDILGVCRISVSNWIKAWKTDGIAGCLRKKTKRKTQKISFQRGKRSNRISKQTSEKPKNSTATIMEKTGVKISLKTLKRICKRAGFSLQRIKKTLKQKKNETDYQKSVDMIAQLIGSSVQGEIDLFYFDESGFNLQPGVKYAWQEKGKQIEVPCSHSKNLNVLGFINGLIANLNLMFLIKLLIQMLSLLVLMSFQKILIN